MSERKRERERDERTGFIIISVHATYYDCASMISLIQFSMRACGVCERERGREGRETSLTPLTGRAPSQIQRQRSYLSPSRSLFDTRTYTHTRSH